MTGVRSRLAKVAGPLPPMAPRGPCTQYVSDFHFEHRFQSSSSRPTINGVARHIRTSHARERCIFKFCGFDLAKFRGLASGPWLGPLCSFRMRALIFTLSTDPSRMHPCGHAAVSQRSNTCLTRTQQRFWGSAQGARSVPSSRLEKMVAPGVCAIRV